MYLLIGLLVMALLAWSFERFYLRGWNPGSYRPPEDPDVIRVFASGEDPGPEHAAVLQAVQDMTAKIAAAAPANRIRTMRTTIDSMSDGRRYISTFTPVDAAGVAAEWVVAPGADSDRRVLYIHGGGFIMGSPKSHRTITSKFSEVSGCAVLAIDYRLMPEHRRMAAVEDCRTAYQWILKNGPGGAGEIRQLYFGGDSAGGNLALSLVAWVRDQGFRAPDAVVALSPVTDCTFSGASIRTNEATDTMLSPMMRVLNRLPRFVVSWWAFRMYRMRPSNPVISPLLGDLGGLPPTLVQASEAEMLLDDARRYVYKASAAGSPVKLQTWTQVVHVWQIFDPHLPQAAEAWSEIGKFIRSHSIPDEPDLRP
jgi:acetyl esterase/lipase